MTLRGHLFQKINVLNFSILRKFRRFSSQVISKLEEEKKDEGEKDSEESPWRSVVGLEIHAQINAKSKLFSGAATEFKAPTNTQVSYFDAALPGTLPVLNRYCVEAAILTALALNCKVHNNSSFDRKHYFYSDLPAGYQITQYFRPIATDGYLDFVVYDSLQKTKPYKCRSRLKQLQIEQDSGRSFHLKSNKTFIDLNRAGIGLMELVFEPDLKNGLEASMLVKELKLILTKLGTCTCAMEEGALRVDANISVHKVGEPWGVRTEVKNINSYKYIAYAVDYEIRRQIETLEAGGVISNETRSFDFKTKSTVFMRDKEQFQDYRFMPEPNLPPILLRQKGEDKAGEEPADSVDIEELRKRLPVSPAAERDHLVETYKISYDSADRIVKEEGLSEYFQSVTLPEYDQEIVIAFLTSRVKYHLKSRKQSFENCEVSAHVIKELLGLLNGNVISEATAIDILEMLFNGDQRSPKEIVEKYKWFLITDEKELEKLCYKVISERSKIAKRYRRNKAQRHMWALLDALNEKVNNRACLSAAESVFQRIIMNTKPSTLSALGKEEEEKKEESTDHKEK